MTEATVRRLRETEWRAFRDLRLDALRTDPLAFGSTFEREFDYPEERWMDWCRRGATSEGEATFVAADSRGKLVGMLGAFFAEGALHLWGMWVHPAYRGRGLGRKMTDRTIGWIDEVHPQTKVLLDVNPDQEAAVRIYHACGFEFNGAQTPLGHHPQAIVRQMARRSPT